MQDKGTKILIKRAIDKKFYFVIQSTNGKVLVTSEMYNSTQSLIKGIKSLVNAFTNTVIKIENHTDLVLSSEKLEKIYRNG